MSIKSVSSKLLVASVVLGLTACDQSSPASQTSEKPEAAPSPYILRASIHDLMTYVVDPSADVLWESVYTTSTLEGIKEVQPESDEEWDEVRKNAITLIEASNLLMMPGRRVVEEGQQIMDEGVEGNLTPEEIQELIDADHAAFVAFAQALNTQATLALDAIDKRDAGTFFEMGGLIDEACEACHTVYWYPNANYPKYEEAEPEN